MNTTTSQAADRDAARKLLAEAINRAEADVPDDAMIDNLEAWDSLAHMRLLTALEQRLGQPLAPNLVVSIRSLDDIGEVLASGTLPAGRMVSW